MEGSALGLLLVVVHKLLGLQTSETLGGAGGESSKMITIGSAVHYQRGFSSCPHRLFEFPRGIKAGFAQSGQFRRDSKEGSSMPFMT